LVALPGSGGRSLLPFVLPGLVPGIHVFGRRVDQDVDGRDKPGHDDEGQNKNH
jgi:hypothetical protein